MNLIFGANNELVKLWKNLPDEFNYDACGNKIVPENPENKIVEGDVTLPKEEVFHISNNLYSFDDAKNICKMFDSKLATYDQIEIAYNGGAEWKSYGWSEGQHIYFPTQKDTWEKLQKLSPEKPNNDRGRPGINGGFLPNKNIFFGVNCFGVKPSATDLDLNRLKHSNTEPIQPKTIQDKIIDAKVKYWKENKDSMLIVDSFNKKQWSQY